MNQIVNVSVSNIYKNPTYQSEITNQALLGEKVEILANEKNFVFVRQADGYEGWINENQLCKLKETEVTEIIVISHFIQIFEEPDKNSIPVRDAVIGCKLDTINEKNSWVQIRLPDGQQGWSQKTNFGEFPQFNRENVVNYARQFIGYPYFWGGRSPKGFDCSGLTQMVFSLLGKGIYRDARMQQKNCKFISNDPLDAQAGDLIFFGEDKMKVDHVGIALGEGKIIHARGRVRINSCIKSQPDYSQKLEETIIAVSPVF
jgi:SH3-like domain-containing protein